MATQERDVNESNSSDGIGTQLPEREITPFDEADDKDSLFEDFQVEVEKMVEDQQPSSDQLAGDDSVMEGQVDSDHVRHENHVSINEEGSRGQQCIKDTIDDNEQSTADIVDHHDETSTEVVDDEQNLKPTHKIPQEENQPMIEVTELLGRTDQQMAEGLDNGQPAKDFSMMEWPVSDTFLSLEGANPANCREDAYRGYAQDYEGIANPDVDLQSDKARIDQNEDSTSLFVREDSPSGQNFHQSPDQNPAKPFLGNVRAIFTRASDGLNQGSIIQNQPVSMVQPTSSAQLRLKPVQRPSGPTKLTYQKLKLLQNKVQKAKAEASKKSSSSVLLQPGADLGHEDYLDSILTPRQVLGGHKAAAATAQSDDPDEKALIEFKRLHSRYDQLKQKNGGTLTFKQGVEWTRIQRDEQVRRRKQRRDQLKDQEEVQSSDADILFDGPATARPSGDEVGIVAYQPESSHQRRLPKLPVKEPNRISLRDAEFRSMQVALEAGKERPKTKKRDHPDSNDEQESQLAVLKSNSKKPKSAKSKAPTKKAQKGPRKTAKQKEQAQRALQQVTSLFSADVFRDQAGPDALEQPTFTNKRNKTEALKELIASLPAEDRKIATNDMSVLLAASKDFDGRATVKPDGNGLWKVRGMATSLKPYQLLGSAFMRRRENAFEEPRGGLMADQMGLGKTLMMLANIVNGRPPNDSKVKTTLLVANSSLLTQWSEEIQAHTDCKLKVMRYRAGSRIESTQSHDILASHDIILTTYTEVMSSYPNNEPPMGCQTAEEKIAWWKEVWQTQRGILHQMQFYRVVLDEAQAIKTHTSRTSIACRALMSDFRWALSGTPVLNGVHELYPYFKFLNVPHTGSFQIFKNNYCDGTVESTERLLVRLSQFMIRRTHVDRMFGAPILKLPQADQADHMCEFNPIERSIYDIVSQRFTKRLNSWSKKGELEGSYHSALVMLLRLRQLTAHVLMLQFVMRDLLEREDIERIRTVVKEHANDGKNGSTIIALRKQLEQTEKDAKRASALKRKDDKTSHDAQVEEGLGEESQVLSEGEDEGEENGENDEQSEELTTSTASRRVDSGRTFGKGFDFKPYINDLTHGEHWERVKKKAQCIVCGRQPPQKPWITSCKHIICESCYIDAVGQAAEESTGPPSASCKECGEIFAYAHALEGEGRSPGQYAAPETRSRAKGRNKGNPTPVPEDEIIQDDWLSIGGGTVLPSAKTLAVKAQILNWIQENPKVKIIVYTQFLAVIRILSKICQEEGWGTKEYHGNLSFSTRDKAIRTFAADPSARVLLASLRCGGLGLNLTMASRVILIDPWWNWAAEQQAFCRVYRIGQLEPTFMTRFCVKNTVDDRILEMQKRKKKEIDSIMEDRGATASKLGMKDLMRLFGPVTEDEQGKPFIMVDNPDPVGGFRANSDHEGYAWDD